VEWRFLHHSNWHRYGDAYAARLEAAWQSGLRSVVLDIETDSETGTRYEVAPTPPARTKWTRRVPHTVLIGHAASLTPY
jgi:hypothetical protein